MWCVLNRPLLLPGNKSQHDHQAKCDLTKLIELCQITLCLVVMTEASTYI